ncbi:hypothetical protein LSAT2_011269 [Lamellibrachia satsuma]|nr:hypothetical protein LSAT2_011269 [Lamellibrachia satsuma]
MRSSSAVLGNPGDDRSGMRRVERATAGHRDTRQAACKDDVSRIPDDVFKTKNVETSTTETTELHCVQSCLRRVRCVAALYHLPSYACASTNDASHRHGYSGQTGVMVYFRVNRRCPAHYKCTDAPCQNGAICTDIGSNTTGIKCTCTARWTGWFCERRLTCKELLCQNGGTCPGANSTTCLCPPNYAGEHCESTISTEKTTLTALPLDPMTDTAPTKTVPDVQSDASKNNTSSKTLNKNVMVVAAVAGVAVASVAVTAAVASTTTTATATTAIGAANPVTAGAGKVAKMSLFSGLVRKLAVAHRPREDKEDEEETDKLLGTPSDGFEFASCFN